jgi:hypothetical protein
VPLEVLLTQSYNEIGERMSITQSIQAKKEAFRASIEAEAKAAQKTCPHTEVGHWDGRSEYTLMYPHRICLACGIEEEGGWWCYSIDCSHWHPKESMTKNGKFAKAVLGPKDGRAFKPISFDDMMKLRP